MKKIIAISLACFFYATSSFGLTLDFYHLWPKGGPSMVDEILWDATKQFEEENPGITINWMVDGHDQWAIKSKAMYTSGDVPHVMATQPADFDAFKEQKMFIKLNFRFLVCISQKLVFALLVRQCMEIRRAFGPRR